MIVSRLCRLWQNMISALKPTAQASQLQIRLPLKGYDLRNPLVRRL